MDFYQRITKAGGFYFTFDDKREIMEEQNFTKIGRGRIVNVVRLDETGVSYKQYSKKGCLDSDRDSVIDDINFRLLKRSKKAKFVFSIILLVFAGLFLFSSIMLSFIVGIRITEAFGTMFSEGGGVFLQ
jgi:hypothetical protein